MEKGHKAGKRDFIEYNDMTKRYEVLYLKKGFRENFKKLWRLETQRADGEAASSSSRGGEADPVTPAPKATAVKGGTAAKGDKSTGKKRGKENEAEEDSPEQASAKKAKKDMDLNFRKMMALKAKMSKATGMARDIKDFTQSDPTWAWASSAVGDLHKVWWPWMLKSFDRTIC